MTSMGRIQSSEQTGLRPVNQRKMAKTIRRAIGMGLHPSVHRHPELIRRQRNGRPGNTGGASNVPSSSDPSESRL